MTENIVRTVPRRVTGHRVVREVQHSGRGGAAADFAVLIIMTVYVPILTSSGSRASSSAHA